MQEIPSKQTRSKPPEAGARIGMLTIVEVLPARAGGGPRRIRCRCDCGAEKLTTVQDARRSETASCGCIRPKETVVGDRFGRLVVLDVDAGKADNGSSRLARVRCDCGIETSVRLASLRIGQTRSCGCLRNDASGLRARTHGCSTVNGKKQGTPEYGIWSAMKARCTNPNALAFPNYGGRGIKVCERWLRFEAFLADMGARPSPQHSIDRIDNDKGYEPGNVRWATREDQQRNVRSNHVVEYQGRSMPLIEACALTGVAYGTAWARLRRGWSLERALLTE